MRTIGRYIIQGLLGHGGMSKVYRVSLPVIGNSAALKLLDPHSSLTDLMGMSLLRDRFTAEARTMARLRHPHIAAIRDFDEADGNLFYVMEYFSNNLGDLIGETYRTEAPSRILSVDKSIHYARQILAGVSRLHHDGIIHRDIKPFNLLITEDDSVKICDFGLSTLRGETSGGPDNLKVGSPFYAAPEQEEAPDQVGFESDIFAIGVVLYRLLTGRLPYTEAATEPLPVSHLNPDLDSNWDDFLSKALQMDPRNRTADIGEMADELETLALDWANKKERICMLLSPGKPMETAFPLDPPRPPRPNGIKVSRNSADTLFEMDRLGQPLHYPPMSLFRRSSSLISDPSRGLVWQQAGAQYPLTWQEARTYIDQLNQSRHAGFNAWRLPTIEELMTILTPPPRTEALCLPPVFDGRQKWLWSSDRSTYAAAWYVNMELGFIAANHFSSLYYAKAVCNETDAR